MYTTATLYAFPGLTTAACETETLGQGLSNSVTNAGQYSKLFSNQGSISVNKLLYIAPQQELLSKVF